MRVGVEGHGFLGSRSVRWSTPAASIMSVWRAPDGIQQPLSAVCGDVECQLRNGNVRVSKGASDMSVETTAALYGAVSGAIATGIVTTIISVIRHFLSRRGGIELVSSNWRFAYLVFLTGPEREKPEYRLYEPSWPFEYEGQPNEAIYAFTADLINKMDVVDVLRDVRSLCEKR